MQKALNVGNVKIRCATRVYRLRKDRNPRKRK